MPTGLTINDAILGEDGQAAARVEQIIGAEAFARYFRGQSRIEATKGGVRVVAIAAYLASMFERRFGESLRAELGAVEFTHDRPAFAPAAPEPTPRRAAPARRPVSHKEECKRRLETFVVGDSNRLAHAAAMRLAEGDAGITSLFIHGGCGLGKTHLLLGIAAHVRLRRPDAHVRYTTAEAFTNEYVEAVKAGKVPAFRRACRRLDLLCIDDVHFLGGKDGTQTELLHTFDAIGLEGSRVVLASDEHPRDIRSMSQHLVSRFVSGAVVKIDPPDADLRRRLVEHLGAARGLALDAACVGIVADHAGRPEARGGSAREIDGLLVQVEAMRRLDTESPQITPGLVKRALGVSEAALSTPRRPIPPAAIIDEACSALGVDKAELMGRGRHRRIVLARAMIVHLCRRLTTRSYPEIARAMGRPNHSTVITAQQRLDRQMSEGGVVAPDDAPAFVGRSLRELADLLAGLVLRSAARAG
ncbi:MAG: ATP-binding protein [Phycisphaerales bacterium]|nr:ATP-binding protein [Phycisphaerales bacterium]